ncbi:MAG: hypothetical protein K0S33_2391 [Bacteroidetes bacterium]|jgi:hypothetical protein|nr:hypothetical protein [Bacteroidota bacterium]
MAYNIRFEPQVYIDVENTYLYYTLHSAVVAKKFYEKYLSALETIRSNPFYQVRYKSFRSYKIAGFPYSIYYEVDETAKLVTCYAVVHLSQDSDKYPK